MHQLQRIVTLLLMFCFLPLLSSAGTEEKKLITAGPSWDRFTNQDGHGLYHDIIGLVFSGYSITHVYVSSVQANKMVELGRADIKMCETEVEPPLVLAKYPMYENDFYVVYRRDRIGTWKGNSTLEKRSVVWREGYYSQTDFTVSVNPVIVRSGESALKMLSLGRVDFYVDDLTLIRQSFVRAQEQFDPKVYAIKKIGARKYFPVFSTTSRGEALRREYEEGMVRLYKEGTLQQIYKHWGFQVPVLVPDGKQNSYHTGQVQR